MKQYFQLLVSAKISPSKTEALNGGTPSDQQARFCYDCDGDHFHLFPFVSRFLPEPRTPVSHPLSVLPNATLLAQLCLFGIMRASDGTTASTIFCGSGGSVELHESVRAAASCSTGPESADNRSRGWRGLDEAQPTRRHTHGGGEAFPG